MEDKAVVLHALVDDLYLTYYIPVVADSDLPLRVAFPLLISNTLHMLGPDLAASLVERARQLLRSGGRLVIPVGPRDLQVLTLVVRHGNDWHEISHGPVVFVPLIGAGGFPG